MNKVAIGSYLQLAGGIAGVAGIIIGSKHPAVPICFAVGWALYLLGRYMRGQRVF